MLTTAVPRNCIVRDHTETSVKKTKGPWKEKLLFHIFRSATRCPCVKKVHRVFDPSLDLFDPIERRKWWRPLTVDKGTREVSICLKAHLEFTQSLPIEALLQLRTDRSIYNVVEQMLELVPVYLRKELKSGAFNYKNAVIIV